MTDPYPSGGTFHLRAALFNLCYNNGGTDNKGMRPTSLAFGLIGLAFLAASGSHAKAQTPAAERYPYGSPAFTRLVADSFAIAGGGNPQSFYAWMDRACRHNLGGASSWKQALTWKRQNLDRMTVPAQKTQREMQLASWLHRTIKADIPHFSLDRGFEFACAMTYGERQCLLQSVLVAGMLQEMGADAGIVMVNHSLNGSVSNNGHCVTLLKRPDGRDVLVDCSDPTPFVRHQGLMAAVPAAESYKYIEPVFASESGVIGSYTLTGTGQMLPVTSLHPLDYRFVRSQFYYYRGERAPGGLLATEKTATGLQQESRFLRTGIQICPQNPLAVYMLGRVYLKQGRREPARASLRQAHGLYARFGWTPQGLRDALAEAGMTQGRSAHL